MSYISSTLRIDEQWTSELKTKAVIHMLVVVSLNTSKLIKQKNYGHGVTQLGYFLWGFV